VFEKVIIEKRTLFVVIFKPVSLPVLV